MSNRVLGLGAVLLLAASCRTAPSGAPDAGAPRRIPIVVWDEGYVPAEVGAQPGERVQLAVTRETEVACAERIQVAGQDVALPLYNLALVDVEVPKEGRLAFRCPTGALKGAVVVADHAPDPGLEHPLLSRPPALDYAASLVGTEASEWSVTRWDGTEPLTLAALRGRVVVVRMFMDECPFCRATLPALAKMRAELGEVPVTFVGLFHSKPRGTESDWGTAVTTARRWGADFALGYDTNWNTLAGWYGSLLERAPTSVTFVIDRNGKFAFVHPGPVFHPATHPDHARCDADYRAVKAAIERALAAP